MLTRVVESLALDVDGCLCASTTEFFEAAADVADELGVLWLMVALVRVLMQMLVFVEVEMATLVELSKPF